MIRCCADKPAIETFFHFKAPRGFSGHRLNGSRGRGIGANRCSPWVVQSLSPSAFFFGGWALAHPPDTPQGDTLPKLCPIVMTPRFGLTSAHVPSQPKGLPPLLVSLEGRKKKRRGMDGWMDGEERLHR